MDKPTSERGVFRLETPDEELEVLEKVRLLLTDSNLEAELLPITAMSKGVQGDEGTYTRVILLKGDYPGIEKLSEISTKISNNVPINKVVYEIVNSHKA